MKASLSTGFGSFTVSLLEWVWCNNIKGQTVVLKQNNCAGTWSEAGARAYLPARASRGQSASSLPAASQKQAARRASSLENNHGKA